MKGHDYTAFCAQNPKNEGIGTSTPCISRCNLKPYHIQEGPELINCMKPQTINRHGFGSDPPSPLAYPYERECSSFDKSCKLWKEKRKRIK